MGVVVVVDKGAGERVILDSGDAWAVCDSTRDTGILKTANGQCHLG